MALTKLSNRSIKDVTSLPFGVGNMILISSQTASNSASISFTTGISSTYKEYQFYFINIKGRDTGTNPDFNFQASTNGGSTYGVTATSTMFNAYHPEDNSFSSLSYNTEALAQSTSFITLSENTDSQNAKSNSGGMLQLFNPSSTTYVKHYISRVNALHGNIASRENFKAGYFNTTTAINAIQFKMDVGNFDGTIAMFGVL
jgi:hypothetical protein